MKAGWRTTEFWVSLGGVVLPQVIEGLPAPWRAALSVGAGAVYALARGLAKLGVRGVSQTEK
jgi:hypothetical protein